MDKPWLEHYDPGVPAEIEWPAESVDAALARGAAEHPERAALIFGARVGKRLLDAALNYRELNALVDRFASGLQKLGVRQGDRVAVMLPNCPQHVIALYAVWRIGAVAVCCNPLYVDREVHHLVEDSGSETFIVLSSLYGRVRAVRGETGIKRVIVANIKEYFPFGLRWLFTLTKEKKEGHRVDISGDRETYWFQDVLGRGADRPAPVKIDPADVSTLIYSGGTTGGPKGAVHTHSAQVYNANVLNIWAKSRKAEEVMLAVMPFFHIYGLAEVLNTTITGGLTGVLIPNPRDMEHVLLAMEKHRATYYLAVPAMFVGFNNHPKTKETDLGALRFAASAAAPLPPEVHERFEEISGAKLVEAYGLTETMVATMNPVERRRHNSIGVPMPNTEVRVVDLDNLTEEAPLGEVGEIVVKGPQVMKEYWNNPLQTAESITLGPDGEGGWFHTADVGYMDEEGYIHIVDRKKDMIIAGGYNVYPADVEAILYEHPKVLEAAVIGVDDAKRGETVKAFCVLREGRECSGEEIMEFCRERMAAYKIPRMVEFRDELPKSLIGKVLRRELREEERRRLEKRV